MPKNKVRSTLIVDRKDNPKEYNYQTHLILWAFISPIIFVLLMFLFYPLVVSLPFDWLKAW